MGRGGGSRGGVSRGGGGSFGGSRGGGGRSGGSFKSGRGEGSLGGGLFGGGRPNRPAGGSFSSGSFGSSFAGGFFGSRVGPRSSGRGTAGSGCGCGTVIVILVVFLIVFTVVFLSSGGGTEVTKSTVAREPLPTGSVNETDYYADNLGWIGNKTELIAGLEHFYKKTGVQPYLFITDTVNGSHYPSSGDLEVFANKLYDELFTDEAHILLVFFEYTPSHYMDYYVTGTQAKGVIDDEAGDILLDYIDKYYYDSSMSEEQFFSKAFYDAADRVMKVTKSPWIIVLVVLGITVLVIILFAWWRQIKKQKNLEAEQTERILSTPIEKFSDAEAENLTKKYDRD
jgi:uncharacterized membrane protein